MRHHLGVTLLVLGLICFGQEASAQKVGPEFKINTTTKDAQILSAVAALADGGFIVSWMNMIDATESNELLAQRLNANGERMHNEFRIDSAKPYNFLSRPALAGLSAGGFVVIWATSNDVVHGQRYDADGSLIGKNFVINGPTSYGEPSVASLKDGGFVVTWGACFGLFAQRYDSDGSPIGKAFRIGGNGSCVIYQNAAGLNDGGFVATWASGGSIYARRYDANGTAMGDQFRVNTTVAGHTDSSTVAALDKGGFVIVWRADTFNGSPNGIFGQRYNRMGIRAGGEFRVTPAQTFGQHPLTAIGLKDGGFIVSWSKAGIFGRRYGATGVPVGAEFRVDSSTTTQLSQFNPSAASLTNGDFVVTWESQKGAKGIYGQRFK